MPTLEDADVSMVSEVEAAGHEQTARLAELEALKLQPPEAAQPSNVGSSEATPVATVAASGFPLKCHRTLRADDDPKRC